jgi:hypothetical protein
MSTPLQINQLTVAEKLRIMEEIWDDLRTHAEDVPMPIWHEELLDERQRLIENGQAQFDDWDAARKRITTQTS